MGEYPLTLSNARQKVPAPSLDSVRRKVFRVKRHFEELQEELGEYFRTNPGTMVQEPDSPPDNPTFSFQARDPVPARFGLIIGDYLQNLRSSLDYLVWDLVLAAGNNPDRKIMFPICTTPDNFERELRKKRLEGVDAKAITVIEGLQPYQAGDDPKTNFLWKLDELTNINKHRRVLLTMLGSAVLPSFPTSEAEGQAWGYGFVPDAAENPIFIAVRSSGEEQANARLGAFLVFDEEPVKNSSVTACLNSLAEFVGDMVIPKFEPFFS